MSCLRRIAGVSRRDRIRNEDIKRNLSIRRDIIEKVEIRRLRYFGHVSRMEQIRLPYIAMHGRVNGMRGRGRPKKRWLDTVTKDCESRGMTLVEAQRVAQDRTTWKTILKTSERATASPRR